MRSYTLYDYDYTSKGKVAVSWLKILAANRNPNPMILSHETAI